MAPKHRLGIADDSDLHRIVLADFEAVEIDLTSFVFGMSNVTPGCKRRDAVRRNDSQPPEHVRRSGHRIAGIELASRRTCEQFVVFGKAPCP